MTSDPTIDGNARPALLAAFACGVLAGAACALLFAPVSGRQARGWVAQRGRLTRAQLMERNRRLTDLVRREGVVGLLRRMRAREARAGGEPVPR
jgi:hypothetical protein